MSFASRKRAEPRIIGSVWQGLAGALEVIADLSRQGAAAARRQDGPALGSFIDRLRVAILDAIKLHNTSECFDDEVKS